MTSTQGSNYKLQHKNVTLSIKTEHHCAECLLSWVSQTSY